MRLLLTKHINDADISKLGDDIVVDFVDVISIENINFETQNLTNKALIFTSINAVKSFFDNETSKQLSLANPIYCVGEQSKIFLEQKGFNVIIAEKNAEALSHYFIKENKEEAYLHFCADIALEKLSETFNNLGKDYVKVISYKTKLTEPIYNKDFDAIAFFSPSGVRSFIANNTLEGKTIFSIGETTTNEIKNWTSANILTSNKNTVEDLLNLIRNHASDKK
ncbi:uroporphyrinogen-III synthase [Soonwooa sp.]|uniref:uroporphyrinogen-III synthase n=1 Tax=Soonwooa sp. TaxID=1938592 RepID=UPI0026078EE0|nr:uroporphyrinogen-III synthase [Soonwooa sp.]